MPCLWADMIFFSTAIQEKSSRAILTLRQTPSIPNRTKNKELDPQFPYSFTCCLNYVQPLPARTKPSVGLPISLIHSLYNDDDGDDDCFLYIASPQQGDLRLSGPPSGQGAVAGSNPRQKDPGRTR
ncbi:hypothetical protein PoB_000424900 [Plakobranchus ocellatus]|uniref:Uncharacterized protein n=1 Tax=Plakobranchus ocellatus TaxID=259542 RepID=A0AAV3Y443_9GAST|nr:hypothetical protein PoB_000424900 [Plakobranchus ocellatus]